MHRMPKCLELSVSICILYIFGLPTPPKKRPTRYRLFDVAHILVLVSSMDIANAFCISLYCIVWMFCSATHYRLYSSLCSTAILFGTVRENELMCVSLCLCVCAVAQYKMLNLHCTENVWNPPVFASALMCNCHSTFCGSGHCVKTILHNVLLML